MASSVLLLASLAVVYLNVGIDVVSGGKFGEGLPTLAVDEIDIWPDTRTFMEKYVFPMKPVAIRGVVAGSRAAILWRSDDYFLSLPIGNHVDAIMVETMKKESRLQRSESLSFKEFIRTYNQTGYYMVNAVPPYLQQDVPLPEPLQCDQLYKDNLVENVMWISSGGTKSVVHTDAADNINCQYVGNKTFVIVDPQKYGEQVDIDHPEGAYSGVDVDNVNYTKYPGLADVKYYIVNVSAGDCIFLPHKWIHQVRSFGRNIAVNLWFDHFKNKNVDLDKCSRTPKSEMTFEGLKFIGFDALIHSPEAMRDHLVDLTKYREPLSPEKVMELVIGTVESAMPAKEMFLKIFEMLDANSDGLLSHLEVQEASDEVWDSVTPLFDTIITSLEDAESDENEGEEYETMEGDNDAEKEEPQTERDEL